MSVCNCKYIWVIYWVSSKNSLKKSIGVTINYGINIKTEQIIILFIWTQVKG